MNKMLVVISAFLLFRFNRMDGKPDSSTKAEKFPQPMWPFRHMSMESMSILATAMNESLLQSYDGILRIFPAFPATKNLHLKFEPEQNISRRDKMFIENGSNNRRYDPGQGRTPLPQSIFL